MKFHKRSLIDIPYKLRNIKLPNYAADKNQIMNPCTGRAIKKTWLNGKRVYNQVKNITNQLRLEYGEDAIATNLKKRFKGMSVSELDRFGRTLITEVLPQNHSFVNNRLVKATSTNLAQMREQLSAPPTTLRWDNGHMINRPVSGLRIDSVAAPFLYQFMEGIKYDGGEDPTTQSARKIAGVLYRRLHTTNTPVGYYKHSWYWPTVVSVLIR